jgi:hypothetical protein
VNANVKKGGKSMKKALWIIVAMLTFMVATASSQERKYRFEFFGQATRPLDKHYEITYPQSSFPIPGMHKFSWGGGGGVRFGIDGAKYWGQDYIYSYNSNATRLTDPYGEFGFTNRFHQACSNVLFYPFSLEQKNLFPYLTAGVGATFVSITQKTIGEAIDPERGDIGDIKGEVVFAFNAGGGVRIRASDRWGVRFDFRDYMSRPLRYGLQEASTDPSEPALPVSGVFHNLSASFGVVIHF